MKLVHSVDGWAVTFGTARMGLGGAVARPGPSSLYLITAHPSTVSVSITVFLYSGPLPCAFNMLLKGFKFNTVTVAYDAITVSKMLSIYLIALFIDIFRCLFRK